MNRLALYVFYEPHGILRAYVRQYLEGLLQITPDVLLIANGGLTDESKDALDALGVRWMQRENRGLDFGAWKAGLERTGWDKVQALDELVLCNCSCYGPVYPFSEMFDVMSRSSCDFWGINRQPEIPEKKLGDLETPFFMKEHIQSYFYVFRQKVLCSDAFQRWWCELVPAKSYWEEVRAHEMEFSGYLEKNGFRSDTFMDVAKYRRLAPMGDAWNICADVQLVEDRNPLVKRKAMFAPTEASLHMWEHIHYRTAYPVGYMLSDYPKKEEFSLSRIAKYRLMMLLSSGERKKRYSLKERKALFLYYLHLITQ